MTTPLNKQEGGNHYKKMKIQPVEFITANKIPFIEGSVIKYVSRWRNKNGIQDLKKAIHFLELLIELENKECKQTNISNELLKPRSTLNQEQEVRLSWPILDSDWPVKPERSPEKSKSCCGMEDSTPTTWSERLEMSAGMWPDSAPLLDTTLKTCCK